MDMTNHTTNIVTITGLDSYSTIYLNILDKDIFKAIFFDSNVQRSIFISGVIGSFHCDVILLLKRI